MTEHRIVIEEHNSDAIQHFLHKGVRDYNYDFLGQYTMNRFASYIKDDNSSVIAGASGFIIPEHKACRLEFVWVDEKYRKQGIGSEIIHHIQHYAKSKGCTVIQLTSMEFQGTGFYQKMGFELVCTAPNWFCGKDELFFVKQI